MKKRKNPYRLGQRRVYPVKSIKSTSRYTGASEVRRKTYASRQKAVALSNAGGGYLGNTQAIVYKRFPGHKCSAACKKAGHMYIHKFPANKKTPLRFTQNRKKLTIG